MSGREKFTNALGKHLPYEIDSRLISLSACVEMLLHLIWRHVAYYSTNQGAGPGGFDRQRPFSLSTNGPQSPARFSLAQSHLKSSTLRFIFVPDAQTFRSEISSLLLRLLQKVDGIELGEEVAGRGWRANQTYLEIMGRCLRELTLPQENETADG